MDGALSKLAGEPDFAGKSIGDLVAARHERVGIRGEEFLRNPRSRSLEITHRDSDNFNCSADGLVERGITRVIVQHRDQSSTHRARTDNRNSDGGAFHRSRLIDR